jgi:hypothetical protein
MRYVAPSLLPIFRSQAQAKILTWLTQNPQREATITDLADSAATPFATAHREIGRLEQAGLVTSRIHGRNRLISVNTANPAVAPLTQLLALTFGPPAVIGEEFDLAGAQEVVIFGSWAARYAGVPGPQPNDIDVLIVGEATMREMFAAARRAEERIGLPVNPQRCTPQIWADPGDDALVRQIRSSHHLTVIPPAESESP